MMAYLRRRDPGDIAIKKMNFPKRSIFMKRFFRVLAAMLTAVLILPLLPALPSFAKNAKNSYDFTGLYITRKQIKIKLGGSYTLNTRQIKLSKDGALTWSSDDESIATVDASGEVTAKALGQTTIRAEKDGYKAECRVIVTNTDPVQAEYEHTMELMQDFLDLRFGMFLHFNSATYEFASKGGDWGGESYQSTFRPIEWNPSKLDCQGWAKAAKSAGMTFAVLTTKHHDGFDLWDSAYTDYDIGEAKLKTDVIAEYVAGCRAEGILPGLYFSMLDVKHQITSSTCTDNDVEFIKAQLTELLTNYGDIPFIIFDGWNAYWGGPHYTELPYEEIVNLVHSIQPDCLVINISCESNNTHSEVAMFESAAGQQVPDWFDNVNISCNTPTAHWFWCDSYTSATFKDVDWVLNQNVNPFAESNTVFILNCSPNKQGVLIDSYNKLLAAIGEGYEKPEDTVSIPEHWAADYDYHNNLLFRKEATQSSTSGEGSSGNAPAIRAVDGYTDASYDHATTSRTNHDRNPWWMADVGYSADLGNLYVYFGESGGTAARTATAYISDKPFAAMDPAMLAADPDVKSYKFSSGTRAGDCYSFDLSGIRGRYVCIMTDRGELSLAEVILTPAGVKDGGKIHSLRNKIADITVPTGTSFSDLGLPASSAFVCADGSYTTSAIEWDQGSYNPDKSGSYTVTGHPKDSDLTLTVKVTTTEAGEFTQVSVKSVTASSQWAQADSLGWANQKNLITNDGLTICQENFLFSTHDNPYNATTMWHSADNTTTATLTFDLGSVKPVSDALIWNHNQLNESNRGVKEMEVYYTDKETPGEGDWTLLGRFTLNKASESPYEPASNLIHFGQVNARKLRFELLSTHGSKTQIGMSQVVFLNAKTEDAKASKLISLSAAFELLSIYDYPEADYQAVKAIYTEAKDALSAGNLTESAASTLCERLEKGLTDLAALKKSVSVDGIHSATLSVEAGSAAFPETLELTIGGKKVNAQMIWSGDPAKLLAQKGSFTLRGRVKDTPYIVTLAVAVRGTSSDALSNLVTQYGALSTDGCDADAVTAFRTALEAAKAVVAKTDATQAEIDSAKYTLKKAKYGLGFINSTVSTDPGTSTDPGNPSAPGTSEDPGTSSDPEPDPDKRTDRTGFIIAAVAAAAVLIAGICAVVIVKKKKK